MILVAGGEAADEPVGDAVLRISARVWPEPAMAQDDLAVAVHANSRC